MSPKLKKASKKKGKKKVGKPAVVWEPAVREVMKTAAEQQAQKRGARTDFNYRWEHVKAVVTSARRLAILNGADVDIVVAAAWLHDVRKDKGNKHPEWGARFAEEMLPTTNFPLAKIPAVARAIRDHMGLWRDEPLRHLESQILWDADKLTKLGLTSAVHWLGAALNRGRVQTTEDFIAGSLEPDWYEKTVASMHTPQAKVAAARRLANFRTFFNDLQQELDGKDID